MPGFNGKGPMGAGSMTGGARGYCNRPGGGYGRRFYGMSGFGRSISYKRRFRGGYGFGSGVERSADYYTENTDDELAAIQKQLDFMKKRIDELKK